MERRGSGIKKILKEYENDDLPEFYSDQQYFIVTLKNKNFNKSQIIQKNISQKSSEKILAIIAQNKYITAASIAESIGISTRAVEKQIAKLKEIGGDLYALFRAGIKAFRR